MPISAISAARRSRSPGQASFCRRWRSIIWGRARSSSPIPEAVDNPFFLLYPDWARIPMVVLAAVATVIASQAVITGAYSLTSQAIQLGLLPRLEIRHTSAQQAGQIYMPRVNALLLIGVLLLVALFRSSSALASAYGIAVTGTMVVTGMMAFVVIWRMWRWSLLAAAALIAPFLFIDLTFLAANMLKVVEGGWVPLALGGVHDAGHVHVAARQPASVRQDPPAGNAARRPGAHAGEEAAGSACRARRCSSPAIRLARRPRCCTASSTTRCCTRRTSSSPSRPRTRRASSTAERVRIEPVGSTFPRVLLRFGYMETPNMPKALGDRAQARPAVRHHVDIVLSVAPRACGRRAALRHAALAGPAVHRARPLRQRRHRLFPDSDRPRGRGRHPGHDLRRQRHDRPTLGRLTVLFHCSTFSPRLTGARRAGEAAEAVSAPASHAHGEAVNDLCSIRPAIEREVTMADQPGRNARFAI